MLLPASVREPGRLLPQTPSVISADFFPLSPGKHLDKRFQMQNQLLKRQKMLLLSLKYLQILHSKLAVLGHLGLAIIHSRCSAVEASRIITNYSMNH